MTILKAMQNFVRALCGQTPTGHNIADVINDGATKVGAITGTNGLDLAELNTNIGTLTTTVGGLDTSLTELDTEAVKYEEGNKSFLLNSSTTDSTKQFRITVADNGTISATEVVAEEPENP